LSFPYLIEKLNLFFVGICNSLWRIFNSIKINNVSSISTELVTERGYQKIVEVYSEYKAKGLIAPNFPELTLVQLMNKLDQFEQTIVESFEKTEVESLTNIRNYKSVLTQYFNNVRGANNSWFAIYLDPNPIILLNNQEWNHKRRHESI